jgi:hypothetical protein
MSTPKISKPKYTLNLDPPKPGNEYLKYGFDRIEELMKLTDQKTKYFPRTILLENIDQSIFEYVNDDKMKLFLNGKQTPVFYLENERWGDFQKTWKFMDNDNNVPTPYITIRRVNKEIGTRLGLKYRVPQPRKFSYLDVPILDNDQIIYLRFKIPEPTNVDLTYDVSLFTKYREDVNLYDEQILKLFASRQTYTFIKGNPCPILLEGMTEANTIENIDGDKFYMAKYTIKILGFIQDEKEFEIVRTSRKPTIGFGLI